MYYNNNLIYNNNCNISFSCRDVDVAALNALISSNIDNQDLSLNVISSYDTWSFSVYKFLSCILVAMRLFTLLDSAAAYIILLSFDASETGVAL